MALRDELMREIAREEFRLAALNVEVQESSARLNALRKQLATEQPSVQIVIPTTPPPAMTVALMTNAAKVDLFRSLFRGREDIFPRRWESTKKNKSGYSPACDNEWEYGLCEKRKGLDAGRRATCGECPNHAFIPVSEQEYGKHLRGDHVMGVYSLLPDETCWFLAADFDKKTWQEDVVAFTETCEENGVPVAIERSRSGSGAHAWFFFTTPVPAAAARKPGCFLITETMARRHQLSMESYDRLFPSQDTMPKGGFGNLIALPRGCMHEAKALLHEQGILLDIEDKRKDGASVDYTFQGTLTLLQEQAVKALLMHDNGVFIAPPGIGKTVVGTYLVAARKRSTLILVYRKPLLDQWIGQIAIFLGIKPKEIGQIGADKTNPNGRLDVAMVQSLFARVRSTISWPTTVRSSQRMFAKSRGGRTEFANML